MTIFNADTSSVGDNVGDSDGYFFGLKVGDSVTGDSDGDFVGLKVGDAVGWEVGSHVASTQRTRFA